MLASFTRFSQETLFFLNGFEKTTSVSCLFVCFDSFCLFSFLRKFLSTEAKNITVVLAKSLTLEVACSVLKSACSKALILKYFILSIFFLQHPAATRLGVVQFLFKYWEQRRIFFSLTFTQLFFIFSVNEVNLLPMNVMNDSVMSGSFFLSLFSLLHGTVLFSPNH